MVDIGDGGSDFGFHGSHTVREGWRRFVKLKVKVLACGVKLMTADL